MEDKDVLIENIMSLLAQVSDDERAKLLVRFQNAGYFDTTK